MDERLRRKLYTVFNVIPESGKLLEIGSYPYTVTKVLRDKRYDVSGIDIVAQPSLNVLKCNVEFDRYPFYDNTFDVVLMMEVIEHLGNDPIHALKEARRVLKPEGIFVLTTPNFFSHNNIGSLLRCRKQLNTISQLTQKEFIGYIGHIREYTKNEMIEILTYCNFNVVGVRMVEEGFELLLSRLGMDLLPWFKTSMTIACRKF